MPADLHIVQGQLREIICNGLDTPLNLYHAGTNGIYYQQVLIQIQRRNRTVTVFQLTFQS